MPKVSVIAPVYRAEKYIRRFIESVLNQSMKDIELVLVDDKSLDHSMEIAKEYAKIDERIKIVYSETNSGPMVARQKGVLIADGEYLNFTDSDDELPSHSLELLYEKAKSGNYDVVAGTTNYIKHDGKETWMCKLPYGEDYNGIITALLKNEYRHNLCAKIIKREIIKNVDYYVIPNMKYFEDYLLFYQVVENCNSFAVIDDIVYNYYQNDGSSTQSEMNVNRIEDSYKAYSYVCSRLVENPKFEKLAKAYVQQSIKSQIVSGNNKDGLIDGMIDKYGFREWLSSEELFKCNSLFNALKLEIGLSVFGSLFYNIKGLIKKVL